ncbi:MAG: anthranilate synthase component I, partial [Deltaproteobacteria bacterium]|nr:anthranilate synthase component I [Deltaproteobacteria bacterium]
MPLISLDAFRRIRQQDPQASLALEIPFDFETPVSLFSRWKNQKYAFLLESVEGGEQWGRYSFIGLSPSSVFRCRGNEVEIEEGRQKKKISTPHPLEVLRRFVGPSHQVSHQKTPLLGGAVGYVAYDAVRFFERLPGKSAPDLILPEFCFLKPEILLVHDRLDHNLQIHFFPSAGLSDQ